MAAPRVPFNVTALNIEVPADGQREVTFSVATGVLDDTWTVAIAGTTVAEGDGTASFVAVFPASADGQRWQLSHEGIERVAGVVIPRPLRNALDLTTLELTVDDGGTVINIEVVAVGPVGPPGVVAATGIATYDEDTQTIDVPMPTAADVGAATAAQGATADTAVQPGDLASVATTGDYDDLTGKPTDVSSDYVQVPYGESTVSLTNSLAGLGSSVVGLAESITDEATARGDADTALGGRIDNAYARANHTGTQAQSTIVDLVTDLAKAGTSLRTTSDLTRTSTTVSSDGVLEFSGVSGTVYWLDGYVGFQGDASTDAILTITIPGGTMLVTIQHPLSTVASSMGYDRYTSIAASGDTVVVGIAGASTPDSARISGWVSLSSSGTVAVGWAANGSGTGITRLANSYLRHGLLA